MKTPPQKIHWFCLASFVALVQLMFSVNSHAATFTVTTTAGSGPGSLRQALIDANANAGLDTIAFSLSGPGLHTIQPLSELPKITDPVVINGTTQPGFVDKPIIELDGSLAGAFDVPPGYAGAYGLWFDSGGSTVRGLVINRFAFSGIVLATGDNNLIVGNFLGTDLSGTVSLGNGHGGSVLILGPSGGHRIGGVTPADRNVISPIVNGIHSEGGKRLTIQGNYIGTDWTGTQALQNDSRSPTRSGILLSAGWEQNQNRIGSSEPGAGNLVSGCFRYDEQEYFWNGTGIEISGDLGTIVEGNLIGTDHTGTKVIGNRTGLTGWDATIGGTAPGAGNLVSGNQFIGLSLGGESTVQGNQVGTDVTGTTALGNYIGISVQGENNLIGGTDPNARNLISGNSEYGLQIQGPHNQVQGNFIGTDVTGTIALPNREGVAIFGYTDNIVGGTTPGARNVVSGNGVGVDIRGNDNKVQGNFIGTDLSGTVALPNELPVYLADAATNNLIGGSAPGAGNLLSGNRAQAAIFLNGLGVSKTLIQGNFIGTDLTGTAPLGNLQAVGVWVAGSSDNTIGGTLPGEGNIIAFHIWNGVTVENYQTPNGFTIRNTIVGNSIFANSQVGIDLAIDGPTLNDSLDGDIGPNNLQNFPIITSTSASPGSIQIQGTLNSTPNTTFILDFYANPAANVSGFYEGQTYLGAATVTTAANGNVSFNVSLPVTVAAGQIITATATDPAGNTSEFSQTPPTPPSPTEGPITQGPNGHYYQVVRTHFGDQGIISWDDAKIAAEQHTFGCLQGHLVTITSLEEDVFVEVLRVQFVAAAPEHVDPHLEGIEFWAGGYQLPDQLTPKDGWFWINDEGPIAGVNNGASYANWLNNEPSDSPPDSAENNIENHLALGRLGVLGWNDEGNSPGLIYGYVIEYEDNTPPQITAPANITIPCSTDLQVPVTFSVTTSDNCDPAPVVTCSPASGSGFPVGTTTVTCTATDASGNTATRSFTVTRAALGFAGFLPPIGGADAAGGSFASPVRTFKKGSTIPVKFTISCEGAPVLSGIHRLQAVKYANATTGAEPIDATPQDAASTGNQFRLTDGKWHFNLDTKGTGMSVGVWQLIALLSDGSQHTVWIQIK